MATAALLLVLFGAACASRDGTDVSAGPPVTAVTPAAPVVESTTTTTALPPDTTPAPAAEPAPVVTTPAPRPATIEVDYLPADGAVATATLTGPDGTLSKSLASGAAIFNALTPGTYSVTVRVDPPSDDPTISATYYLNGNSIDLGPGDYGTIACDDNGCTGTL